jgi:hypothetical protein
MNRTVLGILIVLLLPVYVFAQADEIKKKEVAAEFSTIDRDDNGESRGAIGFGARFTYNLNKNFALETSGYVFPFHNGFDPANNGTITEWVGGLKAGKRFRTWGIFGKVRPGVLSRSQGNFVITQTGTGSFPFQFQQKRETSFATDLGAVLEFYPSKRIVTRFDAGDTLIHFGSRASNSISFDQNTNIYTLIPFTVPSRTTHNFQFSASVGFRF